MSHFSRAVRRVCSRVPGLQKISMGVRERMGSGGGDLLVRSDAQIHDFEVVAASGGD